MKYLISLIGVIILTVIIIKTHNKPQKEHSKNSEKKIPNNEPQPPDYYPYQKKHLLTKEEYKFYKVLKESCREYEYIICPKVRLEDFIQVTDKKNIMKYRGYIKSRHIDFLICDKNLYILAGIELDDNSHYQEQAQKTDDLKNNIFKEIKIPLFRIKETTNYELQIELLLNDLKKQPRKR